MSGTVTSQVLRDTIYESVILLTGSSSVAETAVVKVDASTLLGANTGVLLNGLEIENIWWNIGVSGAHIELLWYATSNTPIIILSETGSLKLTGREPFSIPSNAGAGANGDILFTTSNFQSTDTYSVILHVKKVGTGWTSSSY
jgi:hypothetical protein